MDFRLTPEQTVLQDVAFNLAQDRLSGLGNSPEGRRAGARILAEAGLTGITLPVSSGGQGGSLMDAIVVMQAAARADTNAGDMVQGTNFGAVRQVEAFGSPELKQEFLPGILCGDVDIAAAMSEPEAGSSLTGLKTSARIEGDEIVINGGKIWSDLHATHFAVWARFGESNRDIGCVLVPTDHPGVSRGPAESFMSGDQYSALYFDDVRVPSRYLLNGGGEVRDMMAVFGVERIGNAARAVAMGWAAYEKAVEYAKVREQFGRPLCEFQGLQWKFADMRQKLDAAQLLVYRAASNSDRDGVPDSNEVSIAKCFANESAFWVANEALQIFGAAGYSTENPMEYFVRRTRGWMIAGGSTEILRNKIAEGIFERRFPQWAPRPERVG